MKPIIITRESGENENKRVEKILLLGMNERIKREEEVKNSLLEIIVCQMNSLLFDILNQHKLKIVILRINDSLSEIAKQPYHWETIFLFVVPEEYYYNEIRELFSEVKLPEVGGWYIPDKLNEWSAIIHIYIGGDINISVSGKNKKYKIITEKIKNIFKGSRKIRIS